VSQADGSVTAVREANAALALQETLKQMLESLIEEAEFANC
jgi:hypothetical protein